MADYEYNKKYADAYDAKYERVVLRVPKGQRQIIKDHATQRGESVNEFLNRLIAEAMTSEGD